MASDRLYSDAQWHWVADRVGEGYQMKDLSAFLGMHPNNIRYNLVRIGRRLDYVTLKDLEDAQDEFKRLADVDTCGARCVAVSAIDDSGREVRFTKMSDAAQWIGVTPAEIYNAVKFKYKCHGYLWRKETTLRIREIDPGFKQAVIDNDGYCPLHGPEDSRHQVHV